MSCLDTPFAMTLFGDNRGWVLGIDLGTTNTAAVAFGPGRPGPVSILHGRNQPVMPSVVSLKNPSLPLVGWLAKDMMLTDPLTTIYGWKRFIGRTLRSEYVQRYRDKFPFRIHTDPDGHLGAVIGANVVPFTKIAEVVLDQVRHQSCAALSADVRDCVISVPAHFDQGQRDAITRAGEAAGLRVHRLVNEPTAAALAFGYGQQLDTRVVIFDLGGGTFDASLLEVVGDVFDVKVTQGDGFLGGIDFDRAIVDRLIEHCRSEHRVDLSEEPVVLQRVLGAAEAAKCALSTQETVRVHVPMVGHDRKGQMFDLDYNLTRGELERLTAPLVERALGITEEMLAKGGMTKEDVHHVILVGGQTRMPLVRRRLEDVFKKKPLMHLDPDVCVAQGAATVARSVDDIAGALLIDVLSVPIGIVFPGGATHFVFERNTQLPATKRVVVEPPSGRELTVGLWQGPSVTSSERHVLGVLKMPDYLFEGARTHALELTISETLELKARFVSAMQEAPLLLERARRS